MDSKCSNCGAEINDNDFFCSDCGKPLTKPTCSNCGAKVHSDDFFCSSCGKPVCKLEIEHLGKSNKTSRKTSILVITVAVVVFSILVVTGLSYNTFTPAANSTFNINSVSFKFPDTFTNTTAPQNFINSSSDWNQVGYLLDNSSGIAITIQTNSNSNNYTLDTFLITEEISVKNNNGTLSSIINQTNPNGVAIEGDVKQLTNPNTNKTQRYYVMLFNDSTGTMYGVTVQGDPAKNSQLQQIQQTIFNSIKTT